MRILVGMLLSFVFFLLLIQIIFFEMNYRKVKQRHDMLWFLSLNRKFNYNRTGYMAFVVFFCYLFSSDEPMFSLNWFIYFIMFLALGIISDAVVQFLTLKYAQVRCKKQINEAKLLEKEVLSLKDTEVTSQDYEEGIKKIDEVNILRKYLNNDHHLAFLTIDKGEFASQFTPLPQVTYDVEPYTDIESIKDKFEESPIRLTTLTQAKQMPFKDDKIDIVMNQLCNYDKSEIKRVLKPGGYFILHQNGTGNLKELVEMYVPFRMNGEWNLYSCIPTLESIGFKILEGIEDHNYIRFKSIEGIYNYFKKVSPDLCDVVKYKGFYMSALKQMKENHFFHLSTYDFLVVAQNEM